MYYELYVDVFFMVNFTMDAILLILLKKLLACPAGYGRVFAGAATGAAMTCIAIVIFRKTPVLRFVVFHGVINVVMMKAGLGINGPGIVQRMGALVYRVISAGRCVPVRSTVYKAGKYVLFTGCNQLLPRVGNLENHFILFRERKSLL